jgi:hypothetical protein
MLMKSKNVDDEKEEKKKLFRKFACPKQSNDFYISKGEINGRKNPRSVCFLCVMNLFSKKQKSTL